MTVRLILRSLWFYRRTHTGLALGCLCATMVLVGALAAGDAVHSRLRHLALQRLGRIRLTLSGPVAMRAGLAKELALQTGTPLAAIRQYRASAHTANNQKISPGVRVWGVDAAFFRFRPQLSPTLTVPKPGEVWINQRLAKSLSLSPGNALILRLRPPSPVPGDFILAKTRRPPIPLRLTIRRILSPDELGNFSLIPSQRPPFAVFINRTWLEKQLTGSREKNASVPRADLLLIGRREPNQKTAATPTLQQALNEKWTLSDAGLKLRPVPGRNEMELISSRILLRPNLQRRVLQAFPDATPVFCYLVNEIKAGSRSIPYSFVAAPGDQNLPPSLTDQEVVISEWAANDLQVKPGDSLTLSWTPLEKTDGREQEKTADFRIHSSQKLTGQPQWQSLMPEIPGIEQMSNCRDWDPGPNIDLRRIRPRDEEYWQKFRGTPKLFIRLAAARKLWHSRFGDATAIRIPMNPTRTAPIIRRQLRQILTPDALGFRLNPVQADALRAVREGVPFGALFVGLSFFLIFSALVLTAMLLLLNRDKRLREAGTLLAIGFTKRQISRLFILENTLVAGFGIFAGIFAGAGYSRLALAGLRHRESVIGGITPLPVFNGSLALKSAGILLFIVWLTIIAIWHNRVKASPLALLSGENPAPEHRRRKSKRIGIIALTVLCLLGAPVILFTVDPTGNTRAVALFFSAGALLLAGGLGSFYLLITRPARFNSTTNEKLSPGVLIQRQCARNPARNLTAAGSLAVGVFLLVAVAANRIDPAQTGGDGGFALYGETSLPFFHDLNQTKEQQKRGLPSALFSSQTRIIALRLHGDEDASCLNLNRVRTPRLFGVPANTFVRRNPFRFVATIPTVPLNNPWMALRDSRPDAPVIPGIADQEAIVWGMGHQLGDCLDYIDEAGNPFKIKLIAGMRNSIFQGGILIPEAAFRYRFPATAGYRVLLVAAPRKTVPKLHAALEQSLGDLGIEITTTAERLAAFARIQDAYLDIFLLLGGLGIILGSAGLGLVLFRNIMERRAELALLQAIGFTSRQIYGMLISEHALLLTAAAGIGGAAAIIAVWPAIHLSGTQIPWTNLSLFLLGFMTVGLASITFALILTTRTTLIQALRNE